MHPIDLIRSKIVKDAGWTLLAQAGRMLLQGVYFVIAARSLGVQTFGLFAGMAAVAAIFAPFSACGAGNLIVKYGSIERAVISERLGRAILLLIITGTLLLSLLMVSSPLILGELLDWRVLGFLAVSELFAFRLVDLSGQALQAAERLDQTAQVNLLAGLARAGAALCFSIFFSNGGIVVFAALYMATATLCGIICLIWAVRIIGLPRWQSSPAVLLSSCREGMAFSIGVASKSIYGDIDKAMLARFDSAAVTGFYAAAYRVVTLAFAPVQAVILSSNTRMFRRGAHGIREVAVTANRLAPFLFSFAALAGVVLYIGSPLISWVLGNDFAEASTVLRWLALLPLIQAIHYLYGDALMGAGHQGRRCIVQIFIAVLNVLLNLWLIPAFSWRGAAIATLVCEGSLAIFMIGLIQWYRYRDDLASAGSGLERVEAIAARS